MAHVGVFSELEKRGIVPDLIVGTSIGSVVGGVYAYKNDAAFLEDFAGRFADNPVMRVMERGFVQQGNGNKRGRAPLRRMASFASYLSGVTHSYWREGYLSSPMLQRVYRNVLGRGVLESRSFFAEDTAIDYAAVAADMWSGNAAVLTSGSMPDVMYASSAYPGVCKPIEMHGMKLIDGGVISTVPVLAAHLLGAERIIAVETEAGLNGNGASSAVETLNYAGGLRGWRWNMLETGLADVVVETEDIRKYRFYEFSRAGECLQAGRDAVLDKMDCIEAVVAGAPDGEKRRRRGELVEGYPHIIV